MEKKLHPLLELTVRTLASVGAGTFYSKYSFTDKPEHSIIIGSIGGFTWPITGIIPTIYQIVR